MASPHGRQVILSLFDRLTDFDPRNSREAPPPEWEQLRAYKESVARDLTNLLNVRRSDKDIPEEFVQTRESLAVYGLEDFTTAPMDREAIRRAVERAVRLFEPRLTRVQVALVDSGELRVSFRISGILRVEAGMEPVIYDANLPKDSRRFQVSPGR